MKGRDNRKTGRSGRRQIPALAKRRWWGGRQIPEPTPVLTQTGICSNCGYNLEGLPSWRDPDAKCPECGVSMIRARFGSDLPGADPESLRKLTRGLRLVNASIGVGICVPIIALLSMVVILSIYDVATGHSLDDNGIVEAIVTVVAFGGLAAGFLMWIIGWRITEAAFADRRLAGASTTVRAMLRATNYASVAAVLGALVFAPMRGVVWARNLDEAALALAATLIFATASLGLVLLRGLAQRAAVRRTRTGLTQLLLTAPIVVAGPIAMTLQKLFAANPMSDWAGVVTCFVIVWAFSFIGVVGRLSRVVAAAYDAQRAQPAPET